MINPDTLRKIIDGVDTLWGFYTSDYETEMWEIKYSEQIQEHFDAIIKICDEHKAEKERRKKGGD